MTISQVLEELSYHLAIAGILGGEIYIEIPEQALQLLSLEFAHQMSVNMKVKPMNENKDKVVAYHTYNGFTFRFSR